MKKTALLLCMVFVAGALPAGTLFPLYANVATNGGTFFAVRPFYSHATVPEGEIRDYLWPLYSRKEFKEEAASRALIFWFTHNFEKSNQNDPRIRRWLLPVYFQGRDAAGENYFALFPFGGTIHEFLGRDEISFVFFPVYARSRINEVKTTSVLWPVISHTRGDGIARDRVFPFYGQSSLAGKYDKKFVLWPFWTSAEYYYPGNEGSAWILFPLYGRAKTEIESTHWIVPPFFRFTDGEKQDKVYCPWPFFQRVTDERCSKLYVWPVWGRREYHRGEDRRTFFLWPVFFSGRQKEADLIYIRHRVVPVFFFEKSVLCDETVALDECPEVSRYWHVWPLMSHRRTGTSSRFRLLELWPVRDTPPVERNWAPLWTLYRRTDDAGTISTDTLWFLWHSEKKPADGEKEWSLLRGLAAYKKDTENRQVRLLWFLRFGGKETGTE
ncbi:MAG: hypothetical protein WC959_09390 [Kiritimatiellales bacterium]